MNSRQFSLVRSSSGTYAAVLELGSRSGGHQVAVAAHKLVLGVVRVVPLGAPEKSRAVPLDAPEVGRALQIQLQV